VGLFIWSRRHEAQRKAALQAEIAQREQARSVG
jgi:hypothetical protein